MATRIPLAVPGNALTDSAVRPVAGARSFQAVLFNNPSALARLQPGSTFAGTVTGQGADGATLIRTGAGEDLALRLKAPLAEGSRVTVRVQAAATDARGGLNVTVTPAPAAASSPAGAPAAGPAAGEAGAARPSVTPPGPDRATLPPATARAPVPAPVVQSSRNIVSAVATGRAVAPGIPVPPAPASLPPAILPALGAGLTPGLAPGARVDVRILSVSAPDPARIIQGLTAARGGASGLAAGSASPPPAAGPPLQAGPATAGLAAGGSPAAGPAAGTTGPTLVAVAAGTGAGGQPMLLTALGELTLPANLRLAPGATVVIEIVESRPPRAAEPAAGSLRPAASPLDLARDWPALRQALQVLGQASPVAAQQFQAALPRPGPGLSGTLLFMMAAMRLGDLRSLTGGAGPVRALESAAPALTARLGEELATLGRLAGEAQPGDWRAAFLPLHDGRDLHQLRMFWRRQRRERPDAGDAATATRLIVEFELTELGEMQLDGLSHEGRFDLIVRTLRALPGEIRSQIAAIFSTVRDTTGMQGDLVFRAEPAFAVDPLTEIEEGRDESHVGVVV